MGIGPYNMLHTGMNMQKNANFGTLDPHRRDLCAAVLALCAPDFEKKPAPTQEFLSALYQKLCARMFPDGLPEIPALTADETGYLTALEAALANRPDCFDPYLDLLPLPEGALSGSRVEAQYARFGQAVREDHLMAVMRLGMEATPFDPASHTIGVHNIALHTAILAKQAGFPVDLPLVSAAALGHDIGKFGCRGEDLSRIAYLHYYYTWQWFSRNGMEEIGYVSANHSTWDLEFENLPIESLLLIYADFRVRGTRAPGEKERMRIYSLRDAYEMIFCKLADMTPEKTLRYQNVYHKLTDFENLLKSRGVGPELTENELLPHEVKDPSLMNAEQALRALRDLTLDGSIRLMHTLSTDQTLEQLLEQAKGEKNLQRIRMYLRLLEEYSTYMTKANKRKTLVLLYELLMHPDGDVRRIAGRIMGKILANAGPRYRKERPLSARDGQMPPAVMALLSESAELWTHYIGLCLHPDYRISSKHALRISNSLKTICQSLFASCEEKEAGPLVRPLLDALAEARPGDRFVLVDALCHVPCRYLPKQELPELSARLAAMLGTGNTELDIIALHMLLRLTHAEPGLRPAVCAAVRQYEPKWEDHLAHDWLKARLLAEPFAALDARTVSQIHLSNLKNAVHWTVKLTQIHMLTEYVQPHPEAAFHTALHFSNLLCVSEHLPVREAAGNALLAIAPGLLVDQINEIVIDLTRELESGQEQISRFIPPYLGRLLCLLPEKELGESVESIGQLACGASIRPARVALFTLGEALNVLPEQEAQIADHILGLILTGISHYDETIHQTALAVLCRDIFGRDQLSLARKHDIFVRLHKKLLTLLSEPRTGQLTFFNCAAMLNHLYRYTVRQELLEGPFRFPAEKPAAFFPGTFDPFSVGHKQIVQEIRARGFEVYLAVDEFSWSKKTLPKLLRRRIVSISTADQWDTYLFPDDIPVNIAMPDDLARLRQLFAGREVYLVAGSDVIANASAYKRTEPGTAADYDHIIFCRDGSADHAALASIIRGRLLLLSLPPFYETVSSTRIRASVDQNLDISMLVAPVVQTYIYECGLYVRSPEQKDVLRREELYFRTATDGDALPPALQDRLKGRRNARAALLLARPERLLGWAAGHTVLLDDLYDALGSLDACSYVRQHASGQILFVDAVHAEGEDAPRMLLNELLARSLEEGHTYALCSCGTEQPELRAALRQLGFSEVSDGLYYVDMRNPVMLLQDAMLCIKPPHRDAPAVREAVLQTRPRLRMALNAMFPGKLLLCFDTELLNQAIAQRIERMNGVQDVPEGVRQLGPYMCVPYGKIFADAIVPNTVTKTLHVEKCYAPDVRSFTIEEYPDYSPLPNQVRALRSFHRPMILVDDLLHKGYRIEKLDRVFRQEQLAVDRIVVAVMSGYGRDLMRVQGRRAECEYFIPNLHYWVTESLLYPFIGGDSVAGRRQPERMLPSVNMILPYVYPGYFFDVTEESIRGLSKTALENAMQILRALEREHQRVFSAALTIRRLGEALTQPRLPDKGDCMTFDFSLPASSYLEEDLARLDRICR